MVLLDEKPPKWEIAPPPYIRTSTVPTTGLNAAAAPPPFSRPRTRVTFTSLPQHVLLDIVQMSVAPDQTSWTEHRLALWWLAWELRLACRSIYTVCMHILRSTYLPDYALHIKPYYSSDPFPLSTPSPLDPTFTLHSLQRETAVLDHFILLKIKEDIKYDESELHLAGEGFKDIFELLQPKARIEDLIRHYGLQANVITLAAASSRLVAFQYVSVSFSTRKVGLVITDTKGVKKLLAEYTRETKDEKLEVAAKRLVKELTMILKRITRG